MRIENKKIASNQKTQEMNQDFNASTSVLATEHNEEMKLDDYINFITESYQQQLKDNHLTHGKESII